MRLNRLGRWLVHRATGGLPITFDGHAIAQDSHLGQAPPSPLSAHIRTVAYEPLSYLVPDLLFDLNSYPLTPAAQGVLGEIAGQLRGSARAVWCEGYTDSSGSSAYNYQLGLKRARTVCNTLQSLGMHAHFMTISYGEERPAASNATATGRQQNRRVMLRVSYHDVP